MLYILQNLNRIKANIGKYGKYALHIIIFGDFHEQFNNDK